MVLGYAVWPLVLLLFTKLCFDTPLWVVRSYVPDLFFVIITCVLLTLAGGIICFVRRKSYVFH